MDDQRFAELSARYYAGNPEPEKDGFTWDDVRVVLGEYQISSYSTAIKILKERQKQNEQV